MGQVILHIDDDPRLAEGVEETLQREGYELLHTSDPEETMRRVEAGEPAVVLIEIELADCDGLDLLRGIRAAAQDLPVLVLTGVERAPGLYGEAIALGVNDFLTKPVLASQLLACIHELAPPPPRVEDPPPAVAPPSDPTGDLADAPVPELLARLWRRAESGVLLAGCGKARIGIQLRNGSPVRVGSKGLRPLGAEEARGLSEEEVEAAIGRRVEAALFEAFGWESGSYRFTRDGRLRADSAHQISREPSSLLLAGVLEAAPPGLVSDRLRKRSALYVSAHEGSHEPLDGLDLTSAQERVLADLRGDCTLDEVLASESLEPRLLYGLWVAGRILLHAVPTLASLEELVGEDNASASEPRPVDEATPPAVERAPSPVDEVAPPAVDEATPPPVDEREALMRSVRDLGRRVMCGDDFEALDIPVFATDLQVRAAYERILEQIPEAALHSTDSELRERAIAIKERAEAAYGHLKDAETRRAYAVLTQEEEQDRGAQASADRALEAERWFRKGRGFLEGKRYDEAAEAFGMASHLDADDGEYRSHLGFALYLSNPKESVVQREAMEHIANGIKRSPDRELSYVYLGRILRAQGETDTARNVFRRALRIKPDCHPALQELRLLESREQKGRGVLSRFWRR